MKIKKIKSKVVAGTILTSMIFAATPAFAAENAFRIYKQGGLDDNIFSNINFQQSEFNHNWFPNIPN